jgi:3-phenylpropionate/trans-cinnamate dioxygenase ferredoxin subunit
MAQVLFCKVSEVEANKLVIKRFGRKKIAVSQSNGSFYAFKDACTHDNAPFGEDLEICDGIIQCPRHGAKFDITTGAVVSAPAYVPLETYKLTIENDEIKIDLD